MREDVDGKRKVEVQKVRTVAPPASSAPIAREGPTSQAPGFFWPITLSIYMGLAETSETSEASESQRRSSSFRQQHFQPASNRQERHSKQPARTFRRSAAHRNRMSHIFPRHNWRGAPIPHLINIHPTASPSPTSSHNLNHRPAQSIQSQSPLLSTPYRYSIRRPSS